MESNEENKEEVKEEVKEKNKKISIITICSIVILIIAIVIVLAVEIKDDDNNENISIDEYITKNDENIDSEINKKVLKLRSKIEENKESIIYFVFYDDILKDVYNYEKYNSPDDFNKKKNFYESNENYEIINVNEIELEINFRRNDNNIQEELTYQEIYDEYIGIMRSL